MAVLMSAILSVIRVPREVCSSTAPPNWGKFTGLSARAVSSLLFSLALCSLPAFSCPLLGGVLWLAAFPADSCARTIGAAEKIMLANKAKLIPKQLNLLLIDFLS